jgi:hypothetical protein
MATLRGSSSFYDVGNTPPTVRWTVVRGDTASFRVYVTDDAKLPLNVPDWTISMKIKRPNLASDSGVITDNATEIFTLSPAPDVDDADGEFTVFLSSTESLVLETGDIFDIQLSQGSETVWTVCRGSMVILEDVTD